MFKKLLSLSLSLSLFGGCATPAFYATPSSSIQEKATQNSENIYYEKYKKMKKRYKALENALQESKRENENNSLENARLYVLKVVITSVTYLIMGAFVSGMFLSGHTILQSVLTLAAGACGGFREILKCY